MADVINELKTRTKRSLNKDTAAQESLFKKNSAQLERIRSQAEKLKYDRLAVEERRKHIDARNFEINAEQELLDRKAAKLAVKRNTAAELSARISIYKLVEDQQQLLSEFKGLVCEKQLSKAVQCLGHMRKGLLVSKVRPSQIVKEVQQRHETSTAEIRELALEAWKNAFHIEAPTANDRCRISCRAKAAEIKDLVTVMEDLEILQDGANHLLDRLLNVAEKTMSSRLEKSALPNLLKQVADSLPIVVIDLIKYNLATRLTTYVLEMIDKEIPLRLTDLQPFSELLKESEELEILICELGWADQQTEVRDLVHSAPMHVFMRIRVRTLDSLRLSLLDTTHNVQYQTATIGPSMVSKETQIANKGTASSKEEDDAWGLEAEFEDPLPDVEVDSQADASKGEGMQVTYRTTNSSKILFDTINLIAQEASESLELANQVCAYFVRLVEPLTKLYLALVPLKLTAIEDAHLLLFNDTQFISQNLMMLIPQYPAFTKAFGETVQRLSATGEIEFHQAIKLVAAQVEITLQKADGLYDCTDPKRETRIKDAFEQSHSKISGSFNQWSHLITRERNLMAAGLVLDAALRWVIDAVFNLDDIGEVESHQLISLCSIFTPLEDIFVSTAADETPNPATYCPSWLKFQYLLELLGSSMADVMYLNETEALIDFTTEEKIGLVRRLFADSPQRSRNAAILERS